ncbi:MAG: PEP-CTERM sorting domain-containing protein [Pirellulales bacterium]|nr:PEP-CTERM sorting domain-containing protein [Pirellulales bacterium]
MRNQSVSKILLHAAFGVLAVVALATFAAPTAQAAQGVLFNDTFDVGPGYEDNDINTLIGPPRQSGAFVDLYGVAGVSYYQEGWWGGNALTSGNAPTDVMYSTNGAVAATQQGFGNVFSQGGLTVEFDMTTVTDNWGWMGVGPLGATYWPAAYGCPPLSGAAMIAGYMYDYGSETYLSSYQFFSDTTTSPVEMGTMPAGVDFSDQGFHSFKVEYTDPTDGNPFDFQGETDVTYYVKDSLGAYVQFGTTQVFADGGLTSAVVHLSALNSISYWDNLKVTGSVDAFANPWNGTGSQNWSLNTNWDGNTVPNASGAIASFLDSSIANSVTVDISPRVGSIVFGSVSGAFLNQGGSYTITLDNTAVGGPTTSSPATIAVEAGYNTISVPLVLDGSNLVVSIRSENESLNIEAGLDADGNDVTVTSPLPLTWNTRPGGCTVWPSGSLTVLGQNVTGIETLKLDFANLHVMGVTLEAEAITGGTGGLFLEGGTVLQSGKSGNDMSIDVEKLDLMYSSSYTAGTGVTVRTSVVCSSDWTGTFTLDGGTLAMNNFNSTGGIGLDLDIATEKLLYGFYIGPNGGTIDGGGMWSNCSKQLISPAPGTDPDTNPAGPLTINGQGVLTFALENDSLYSDVYLENGGGVYTAAVKPLGPGTYHLSTGGTFCFAGTGAIENDFTTEGPGVAGAYFTTLLTDGNGDFQGNIDLNDDPLADPASYARLTDMANFGAGTMVVSGKLTGDGGLCIGSIVGYAAQQHIGWKTVTIAGDVSNDYTGPTVVIGQYLKLAKDNSGDAEAENTAVAVAGDLVLDPNYKNFASSVAVLVKDNQTGPDCVVHFDSPSYPAQALWTELSLQGHTTTVRGLVSEVLDGLNGVENACIAPAFGSTDPEMQLPADPGNLTIKTKTGDDFTFAGYMGDTIHIAGTVGAMSLVKDGPGTQRFLPTIWGPGGLYIYTGGTTVKDGTLDVSALGAFTPNSPIVLEGGTLIAGNVLSGPVSRGDTTSGTLEAGGTTYTTLACTGLVDIGEAVIDAGHTLEISNTTATNVIDVVTGASDSTLHVTTDASLTSSSITVGTLTIGGTPPPPPSSASTVVPEPSTWVLLALGSLAFAWFRLRK